METIKNWMDKEGHFPSYDKKIKRKIIPKILGTNLKEHYPGSRKGIVTENLSFMPSRWG
jgi:hypothetical protein